MKTQELISIIVPIYNTSAYLNRCISSIVQQTYHNLEILLINDGSTDQSESICLEWARKDNRILYISQTNKGVCSARNLGLSRAKGDYIGFIDSDDYIAHNMYESLYNLMKKNNCDLAICGRTRVIGNQVLKYSHTGTLIFNHGQIDIGLLSCQFDLNICTNKLYCYKFWEKLRFPEHMTFAEDLFIVPDILSLSEKTVYTSEGLYYYLERNDSASFTLNEKKAINDIQAKKKLYSFLQQKGVNSDIAFDWLFGAYTKGYKICHKKREEIKKDYNKFFRRNIDQCLKKKKCILFLLCPFLYFRTQKYKNKYQHTNIKK